MPSSVHGRRLLKLLQNMKKNFQCMSGRIQTGRIRAFFPNLPTEESSCSVLWQCLCRPTLGEQWFRANFQLSIAAHIPCSNGGKKPTVLFELQEISQAVNRSGHWRGTKRTMYIGVLHVRAEGVIVSRVWTLRQTCASCPDRSWRGSSGSSSGCIAQ